MTPGPPAAALGTQWRGIFKGLWAEILYPAQLPFDYEAESPWVYEVLGAESHANTLTENPQIRRGKNHIDTVKNLGGKMRKILW